MIIELTLNILLVIICICLGKYLSNKLTKREIVIRQLNTKCKQLAELGSLYAEAIHCLSDNTFQSKEWIEANITKEQYEYNIRCVSSYARTLFFKFGNEKIEAMHSEDFLYFINFFEDFIQFCTFNKPFLDIEEFHLKTERFRYNEDIKTISKI